MTAEADRAVSEAHRRDWALVLAATVRVVRELDLAEECVQEAYADALRQWRRVGVPENPSAWLTTAARRRGIDAIRRGAALRTKLPLLLERGDPGAQECRPTDRVQDEQDVVVLDERLRLILLCCHPALAPDGRSALTLRLVCGMSTPDIAAAFLVSEATAAARITRAKRKIAGSGIPFRMPEPEELPDRLEHVLEVVHLLFTTGHTAPSGDQLVRVDLVDEAIRLARLLHALLPAEPEIAGLLALMLATDARRDSRVDGVGRLVRLQDQDRARWDATKIADAAALVRTALPHPRAGRYALEAAIATLHAEASSFATTDWRQLLGLYDALLRIHPSPVVALNRLIPLAQVEGADTALNTLAQLEREPALSGYRYLMAVKADLLLRLGRPREAAAAGRAALALTASKPEQDFLRDRIAAASAEIHALGI